MPNKVLEWTGLVQLRSGAAQEVAIAADDPDVLTDDMADPRLASLQYGILIASVSANTGSNKIELKGRNDPDDDYEVLATIEPPEDAVGVFAVSIDRFRKFLNFGVVAPGSITFGLVATAPAQRYNPERHGVIAS